MAKSDDFDYAYRLMQQMVSRGGNPNPTWFYTSYTTEPPKPNLAALVEKDIAALTAGLDDFHAKPELPRPPVDLSKYEDALEIAIKNCPHDNMHDLLWQREWVCDDCQKHFNRAEMLQWMKKRGPFG